MQYTVTINQRAVIENGFDLDVIDVAVFDFIRTFAPTAACQKLKADGDVYYYISHTLIIRELPLLGISTPAGIIRRINRLIAAGLIERHPDCEAMHKTFYRFGPNFDKMLFGTLNENSQPSKSVEGTLKNYLGSALNENLGYHNTNIDNNTKNNTKENSLLRESKRKAMERPTVEDVKAYCVDAGISGVDAAHFVDYYTANGWKIGSQPMKDWRATIRNWARREAKTPPPTPSPQRHYYVKEDPTTAMLRRWGMLDENGHLKKHAGEGGCDEQ